MSAYREGPPLTVLLVSTPPALLGVDAKDGRTLWTYVNVPDTGATSIVEHAGLDDAPCVFFYRSGHLACVHRETGEEIWSVGTGLGGPAAMVVHAGSVFLASDAVAECWSFRGEFLWRQSFPRGTGRSSYDSLETLISLGGAVSRVQR
jgi:outer membrane protein assembly factor BamB